MAREERNDVRPLKNEAIVPVDGYGVFEWSPSATHANRPTQVHLVLPMGEGYSVGLRLKSRRACQELIEVLAKHRDAVWGKGE